MTALCIHFLISLTDPKCNSTDIRLIGSSRPNEGRVEYCYEEVWGTVCSDKWDDDNAMVVCSELGLPTESRIRLKSVVTVAIVFSNNIALTVASVIDKFGGGTGPILLDDVECMGNESSLSECFQAVIGNHNCHHHEDVGVRCGEDYVE